jgi:hypothetical protein
MNDDALLAPIEGVQHQMFGGAQVDIAAAGAGRIKRIIYPPGHRWTTTMQPLVGTDLCMHGHVGFLARGRLTFEYADGCVLEFVAPQVVVVEPEHDAYVPGDEPAVLIQFDFEGETNERLGLPERHQPHD